MHHRDTYEALLDEIRSHGGIVGPPGDARFGCAELDALLALTTHLGLEDWLLDLSQADDAHEHYDFTAVFAHAGHNAEQVGPLVRLTDEGIGPDGIYVEVVGDAARVWWVGHDPFDAKVESESLVTWLGHRIAERTGTPVRARPRAAASLPPMPAFKPSELPKKREPTEEFGRIGPLSFRGRTMHLERNGQTERFNLEHWGRPTLTRTPAAWLLAAPFAVVGPVVGLVIGNAVAAVGLVLLGLVVAPVLQRWIGRPALQLVNHTGRRLVRLPNDFGPDELARLTTHIDQSYNTPHYTSHPDA